MLRGLETSFVYEEWIKELGLFSLKKAFRRSHCSLLITKEAYNQEEDWLFAQADSDRARGKFKIMRGNLN